MPFGLEQIPAWASKLGSSAAGLTLRQAPKAASSLAPGFNPLTQIPAAFSRFGNSAAGLTLRPGTPSIKPGSNVPGLLSAGTNTGIAGLSSAALYPLIDSAHWAQQQLQKANLIPSFSSIQNRPVVNPDLNRPDFSGAGERARRFQEYRTGRDIPGANTDYSARLNTAGVAVGSPAAERAYQQEASRVAQLTAQDPELQRYEAARLKAVAPGAAPETVQSAEDIGMQMWAKANPTLAAKVKPGQAGYDAIQNQLNAGQMGAPMELGAFAGSQPTGLLFNPSSPLGAPPQTGGTDYTQVVPATIPGAQGVMGSYFNNQQQAKMFSRFQQAAPAQTGMNPGLAPGSPYAQAAAAAGGASYAGAAGLQPMGASLAQDANAFASEKARLQAEEFKKRALSMQQ